MKHEWRKTEKTLYLPPRQPVLVNVEEHPYITIHGEGSPDDPAFARNIEALYSIAYGIKMSDRKGIVTEGFHDYAVYPLEGIWDINEAARKKGTFTREQLVYTLMIRQPDFVTQKLFDQVVTLKQYGDNDPLLRNVSFLRQGDGKCVQMLHVGPFATEKESFDRIEAYLIANGLKRRDLTHREIYLSDFRKTDPNELKTVLRVFVE